MRITVSRDTVTPASTTSIVSIDNVPFCYGLEPPIKRNTPGPVAFAPGVFVITIVWSRHNTMYVPLVNDVPGHSAIEIHHGNFPKDTLDCLVVGMVRTVDRVLDSDLAFAELFRRITKVMPSQLVTIEYINALAEQGRTPLKSAA